MVVNDENKFLCLRQEPRMALISTSIRGDLMYIDAPGKDTLKVPLTWNVRDCKVNIYRIRTDNVEGIDCGAEAEQWFTSFLGRPCHLAFAGQDLLKRDLLSLSSTKMHTTFRPHDTVAYSDLAPLLVMVENSLADLNSRLKEPVTMKNFRPNIVIKTNSSTPFDEDTWSYMYVGQNSTKLYSARPCDRCIKTTVNPKTGTKSEDMEPLTTLKKYRNFEGPGLFLSPSKGPLFGLHTAVDITGPIKVGDPVYVIRRKNLNQRVVLENSS